MKLTRQQIVLWVIVIAAAAAILNPLAFLRRGQYRGEVRALFDTLQLDMTREEVRRGMDTGRYPHLEFRRAEDAMWLASTPDEFGAKNWILLIEFQGDHVSALRVRTEDGFQESQRPAEAPADKVRPSGSRGS